MLPLVLSIDENCDEVSARVLTLAYIHHEFKGHICSEESGAGEGLGEAMSSHVKFL